MSKDKLKLKPGQKKDDFVPLAKRLPVKTLLDFFHEGTSVYTIADALGVTPPTVRKWIKNPETTIHFNQADIIAIKHLGLHPANIWGELWWVPEGQDYTWAWKYIDD
jgi:DNA invertase Pin-like site-specific DNA recombinase